MIKTYFINGFLDSGKTTFIKELLGQNYFKTKEKTLLILCEDGEEEYELDMLEEDNIFIKKIGAEKFFSADNITRIEREIHPTRVIVEYNGMWKRNDLVFPWYWDKPIEIAVFNAEIFEVYEKNMKFQIANQIRYADMAIFNRCDSVIDKLSIFKRQIKAVTPEIKVVFNGEKRELDIRSDEDLPYDIKSNEISLTDDTYAVFYLDVMENVKKYLGKMVNLTGKIMRMSEEYPEMWIIGRFALTCCSEDLSLFGFICESVCAESDAKVGDWVNIRAYIDKDYAKKLNISYPVLNIVSCEKCQVPEREIVNIY